MLFWSEKAWIIDAKHIPGNLRVFFWGNTDLVATNIIAAIKMKLVINVNTYVYSVGE